MNIKTITSNSNLAFIVGAPRSGTTLLMSILNSHPEIHIVPEFKFYLFYLSKYKNIQFNKKKNRIELVNDFNKYLNHKKSIETVFDSIIKIDQSIVDKFIESDLINDFNQATKILYCSISMAKMRTENPTIILEKNPAYTQHIDRISKFNPQAKYIGIVRDHRASISSRIASNERAIQNIQYYAKYWELINSSLYKHAEKNPENILIVHYQDLLNQSKNTIEKCVHFLNLKSDFDYTTYQYFYKNLVTELKQDKELLHKERWVKKFEDLSRPINSSSVNKWKEKLSKEQINCIEQICQGTVNLFFKNSKEWKQENTFAKKSSPNMSYYKALINFYLDDYRFKMSPNFNIGLEKFVRKIGVV